MINKEIKKETSELVITVEANVESWKQNQADAKKNLMANLSIKGFRKGKVPADIANKHISKADIFTKAIQKSLDAMAQDAAKEIKEEQVLAAPAYAVKDMSEDKLVVEFIYPVYPEVKLPDYKNLGVKFEDKKVTDEVINAEIEKITSSQSMLKNKDGAIAKGNVVTFDFEGFVDGEAFEGGKAEKFELEIGSGQFIPGFEDQMIGLNKGDKKDVNVSFPADYHAENLKGKPAVFKVTIHDIKEKEKAELNDAFVEQLVGKEGIKTVAEFKEYLTNIFKQQFEMEAKGKFQSLAFDKINETAKIVVPAQLLANEMNQMEQKAYADMKQQGISKEQYFQFTGTTPEAFKSQFKAQAERRLRDAFIFAELSKAEKIEITEEEYEKEYEKLAKVYKQSVEGVKGMIRKEQMQIPMMNDRVVEMLIKNNQ